MLVLVLVIVLTLVPVIVLVLVSALIPTSNSGGVSGGCYDTEVMTVREVEIEAAARALLVEVGRTEASASRDAWIAAITGILARDVYWAGCTEVPFTFQETTLILKRARELLPVA